MCRVVKIEPADIDCLELADAAAIMRAGGLVIFPTETVYGLGTTALSEDAVMSIFAAKRRNDITALPVQIPNVSMLQQICREISPAARALADRFWPGPLTLVLPKSPLIPDCVTSGQPFVGVRIPNHPVAIELLKLVGSPIVATSANISGKPAPVNAQQAMEMLGDVVDIILDSGPCTIGVASSVVKVEKGNVEVLREGSIPTEEILEVANIHI